MSVHVRVLVLGFRVLGLTIVMAAGALAVSAQEVQVDFNRDIRPVLSDKCMSCHGPDEASREGELRFDTREGVFEESAGGVLPVVPGKPDESEIIYRIELSDDDDPMPPPESGLSLTPAEKALFRNWVKQGAPWKKHWSFEPVQRPELPEVSDPHWCRNGIDQFVLSRLDSEGLKPSSEADKRTLIRRVSLDLTGLPPTLQEIEAFLADNTEGAYDRLVDRLLKSSRYGEHMALPWLDAARYADTNGYQNDGNRYMWRWRDWVIDAYNDNLPFDQFTIEQLAGDLLDNATLQQKIATGFNRNHRYNSEAGIVLKEYLLENAVDRIDTTATLWMGLTMGCARCHDHKYDPFSQKEYYQLLSFFNNVPEAGRAIKFNNSEPLIKAPTDKQAVMLAQHDKKLQAAEKSLRQAEKKILTAQRQWEANAIETADEKAVIAEGLVDHFSFDQTDGAFKNATLVPGMIGNAIATNGKDVYQTTSGASFLAEKRASLSVWIQPKKHSEGVILSKQAGGTKRPGLTLELKEGRLQCFIITRWISGVGAIETVKPIQTETWSHVVVSNDGSLSTSGMKIYVDGNPVETRTLHNTNSNNGGAKPQVPLRIGGGVHGAFYEGLVDELRFYGRTLSPEEVVALSAPQDILSIIRLAPEKRSDSAAAKLRTYFLKVAAPKELQNIAKSVFRARAQRQSYNDSLPTTMVMEEMVPPRPSYVRVRGVYDQLGEQVYREFPEAFSPPPKETPKNRLGFAQWLVSGKHPLTGRVAINRYWLKYFGRGLVKTAEDFGLQGDAPTHPLLLDWLSDEFVRQDWNVKAIQKLIVTSATYRQQSRVTPELLERDPENVWLARGPRFRLTAHSLRDQALAVSGLLVEKVGGPSVNPYQPANLWSNMSNMKYKQSTGDDLYRRSLYTIWKRTVPPPTMALLDAANRENCVVGAKRTNTPLHALTLLNEITFVEAARNLGQRMLLEGGDLWSQQIEFAFETLNARSPSQQELSLLEAAYEAYRKEFRQDVAAATKLIAVGDSRPHDKLPPADLAAATAMANVLLNLDEFLTKE